MAEFGHVRPPDGVSREAGLFRPALQPLRPRAARRDSDPRAARHDSGPRAVRR